MTAFGQHVDDYLLDYLRSVGVAGPEPKTRRSPLDAFLDGYLSQPDQIDFGVDRSALEVLVPQHVADLDQRRALAEQLAGGRPRPRASPTARGASGSRSREPPTRRERSHDSSIRSIAGRLGNWGTPASRQRPTDGTASARPGSANPRMLRSSISISPTRQ
jgi:hypothetical protein